MSFKSFVAGRYLKIKHERKLISLITILATLGVAVGVMVLVVVIAVMSGFRTELKRRILGAEAHLIVKPYDGWVENHDQVADQIEAIKNVTNATPFVHGQGMLRASGGVSGIVLRGVNPDRSAIDVNTKGDEKLAQLLKKNGPSHEVGIVMGIVMADKLKLKVGDGAILMVVGNRQPHTSSLPRMHRLKVVGLFETGMNQYDEHFGYMHMQQLQRILGMGGLVTGFEVRVEDPDRVELVKSDFEYEMGGQFYSYHWKQMYRNLFKMLSDQKLIMYIILTLIVLVAAFNVTSALIMMVKEKTKDIAIMKAMGATDRSLNHIFLSKGMVIGCVGVCIGVLAGLGVCLILANYQFIELPGDVYFMTTLPVDLGFWDLFLIVSGTMAICALASFYPAYQAAKMNPVDAIRYS